jgi:hypothetical protein
MGLRQDGRARTVPIVVKVWSLGSVSALSAENLSNLCAEWNALAKAVNVSFNASLLTPVRIFSKVRDRSSYPGLGASW